MQQYRGDALISQVSTEPDAGRRLQSVVEDTRVNILMPHRVAEHDDFGPFPGT